MNCPNCGAVIKGATCEYCGAVFYDFVNLEPGKRTYIRMKVGSKIHTFIAFVESIDLHRQPSSDTFYYYDDTPVYIETPEALPQLSVDLQIVSDETGIYDRVVDEKELERY